MAGEFSSMPQPLLAEILHLWNIEKWESEHHYRRQGVARESFCSSTGGVVRPTLRAHCSSSYIFQQAGHWSTSGHNPS